SGASGNGQPPVSLIDYPPGLIQDTGIDPAIAQVHGFGQRSKMINKMCAGVLAAEQPKTSAGHYRRSSRGWSTSSASTISLSSAASTEGIWVAVGGGGG